MGRRRAQAPAVARTSARSGAGIARVDPRPVPEEHDRAGADRQRPRVHAVEAPGVGPDLLRELHGHFVHVESQQVAELGDRDDDRDAGCEPHHDRVGHELDHVPQAGEPHEDHESARHHRRHREAVVAVGLDDPVDEHDEGTGGATDLDAASAQSRDQEPGDDRREEPLLGPHTARDRERQRERQRHDPDLDASRHVAQELAARISLAQNGDELGLEFAMWRWGHGGGMLPRWWCPGQRLLSTSRDAPSRAFRGWSSSATRR